MPSKKAPATLKKVSVSLPFGIGKAEWEADETELRAAWNLYVELSTRVAVQPLPDGQGSLRRALDSLYDLFVVTRQELKAAGPAVAKGPVSFGAIAIDVLNRGLRPFLTKWHPLLEAYEEQREEGVSRNAHESRWAQRQEFREELAKLQEEMALYVEMLAEMTGVAR